MPIHKSTIESDRSSSSMNCLSKSNTFYPEVSSEFSTSLPSFLSQQPQQRCLKEITTESEQSNYSTSNDIKSSTVEDVISMKTVQSNNGRIFSERIICLYG